jgi:hypothetical protein
VRASSAWFEGEMDVGSDTSRYLLPLDMVAALCSGAIGTRYRRLWERWPFWWMESSRGSLGLVAA